MYRTICLVAVLLALVAVTPAFAARLLVVTIEHDGKLVQTCFYEDDGTADKPTMWSYLGRDPLAVDAGGAIVASKESPLHARLAGPTVIKMTHAKSVLVESRVENLNLTRVRADRDRWFLSADEVKRSGTAAGLKLEVEPASNGLSFWTSTLGIVVFLVMVFVIGFVLYRVQAASSSE